ncbi:nucleoside permease [Salmonella enterica subsp. enterica]|uniref:Nucleoside permease n=1 Tax=Salmonella enterica I TaxID=59201 RepID=A0A447TYN9_SALET|nr:nucleoside permease [Salmonella enterica subsp. enterica]
MIVYGCAFDFFNISGSVFVEQEVDSSIRASAQGLFMTMVNGVGAWIGSLLSGMAVDYFSIDGVKDWANYLAWSLPPTLWHWPLFLHCSLNISTIQKNCRPNSLAH